MSTVNKADDRADLSTRVANLIAQSIYAHVLPNERTVLIALIMCIGKRGEIGLTEIAEMASMTTTTVRTHLHSLEMKRYITIRYGNGRGHKNYYTINL